MNDMFNPTHSNSELGDFSRRWFVHAIRPLTRNGQVSWVRLAALTLSLFAIAIVLARVFFGFLAPVALASDSNGPIPPSTPAIVQPVLRSPAPVPVPVPTTAVRLEELSDLGISARFGTRVAAGSSTQGHPLGMRQMSNTRHIDPLEQSGIDPTSPKHHVDPLEDVGIDPRSPKHHVDPLEHVGIAPTSPKSTALSNPTPTPATTPAATASTGLAGR